MTKLRFLKPLFSVLIFALQFAVACAALASVAGFFSSICYPFELLSHFRVPYLACFTGFTLLFLMLKRPWSAGFASLMALINLIPIAYLYVPPAQNTDARDEVTIRVVQLNAWGGRNRRYDRAVSEIRSVNPDLIGMSEVPTPWTIRLKKTFKDYPYQVMEPQYGGVALFSKYPLSNNRIRYFGEIKRPRILSQMTVAGKTIDLLFVHPVNPTSLWKSNFRDKELAVVANEASQFKNPGIVFGDMNTTPWSWTFDRLLTNGKLVDSERGFGFQPTWNARMRVGLLPIDHLLTTSHFVVRDRRVLKRVGSDHYPVFVELVLKD